MSLGSTLQRRREEMNLTQSMVSIRIGKITHQAVSNWERDLSIPSDGHIAQLAEILALEEGYLRQEAVAAREKLRLEIGSFADDHARKQAQAVKDTSSDDPLASLFRGIRGLFG